MYKKDILWAPWRLAYIRQIPPKGCFLCKALKAKAGDEKNYLVYRGKRCFVILNLFPYNNGHIMVVPNRHISTIENLSPEEEREFMFLIKTSVKILGKVLNPQGFNIGINIGRAAGAGLKTHIHMHVVPRWTGDTNFAPVVCKTKIISQSLEQLYGLLYAEFKKIKKGRKALNPNPSHFKISKGSSG
ncbi:MAG: HIT domain-containing protein [Candidatus Omnitrophica bacterium]|nr:HIT domain-containing protein [Candidatus Omnitrophota bacterium]